MSAAQPESDLSRPRGRPSVAAETGAICAVAAPLAAANLAQITMQVTNTVMVAHLGPTALAAAGLGTALYSTLTMTCQGVLTAVSPLAAHAVGADDHPSVGRVAAAGLVVAAVLTAPVVAVLGVIPLLLAGLGYDLDLVEEIRKFLHVVCWGAPAFLGFTVLRFMLVALFRARIVMLVSLAAVPLNILLNWALIYGHLGLPAFGIAGSAGATATVHWLILLCFSLYLLMAPVRVPLRVGRNVLGEIPRLLRLGIPIGALRALEIGLFVATGISMGVLGADALGAHQLVFNLAGVCFMVPLGIGQAATVRIALHLGAGRPDSARRAGSAALILGAVFMAAVAVILLTLPMPIIGLYLDVADPANQGLVATALRLLFIAALFQVFDGVQVIAVGALRGYRDATVPMAIAAIGYWAVGFAGGWLLAFPLGIGAIGLWSGLAAGLAVVAVSLTVRFHVLAQRHVRDSGALPLGVGAAPARATISG